MLGRSVADLALALSTIAGPDSRAPLSINEPGERLARPLNRGFKGARMARYKDPGGVPFDPRVRAVVDARRNTFESPGCIVDQVEPDFAPAEVACRVLRVWNTANSYGERFRAHPEAFKGTLRREIETPFGARRVSTAGTTRDDGGSHWIAETWDAPGAFVSVDIVGRLLLDVAQPEESRP
jgi:Asp-tRNA(Asn)/Glu-tRNA(Gln) amidotransferase A subunit family amidase